MDNTSNKMKESANKKDELMTEWPILQSGLFIFITLTIFYLVFTYVYNAWILTDQLIYQSFSDQLQLYSIETLLQGRDRFWWVSYLVQPVMIFVKVSFLVLCVSIGAIFSDVNFKVSSIYKTGLYSEFIFIIGQFIFLANLFFNRSNLTLDTTVNYFPLSILSYIGIENVVQWLHYPLQTLNLFELVYVICISWLLSKQWKPGFVESLNIVIPSYGIGLLVWMVLVVFLSLQIS
jgi:hypothetical protein